MPELHIIAHNIRSTENVGAIFRTCDSLGISKLWLTGYTPTPEHPKVKKTALGAEASVAFEKTINVEELIAKLKEQGFRIVGLELDERARALDLYEAGPKVVLLLGNEVEGISPYLLEQCDDLVFIKQKGVKESLNVSVAAGIAMYSIMLKS
ncbi:MAG: TrmH family RNA methyltransferase [Patescibacteria group bacterium]|nr:TrmH family RNA methyltransferase [Patescibacteria group bacterium]